MASGTEGDEVVFVVGTTVGSRVEVVDGEVARVVAAFSSALEAVAGEDFASGFGRDGGFVGFVWVVDHGVAGGGFFFGF